MGIALCIGLSVVGAAWFAQEYVLDSKMLRLNTGESLLLVPQSSEAVLRHLE